MKNYIVVRIMKVWNLEETQIVSSDFDVIGVCTNWDSVRSMIGKSILFIREAVGEDSITYENLSVVSYKTIENRRADVEYKVIDFEEMDTLL